MISIRCSIMNMIYVFIIPFSNVHSESIYFGPFLTIKYTIQAHLAQNFKFMACISFGVISTTLSVKGS
jgi:hypothetical protein